MSTQASRKLDDIDKLVWIETSHLDQRPQGDILLMDITFLVTLKRELSSVNSLTFFIVDITFVVTLNKEVSGESWLQRKSADHGEIGIAWCADRGSRHCGRTPRLAHLSAG